MCHVFRAGRQTQRATYPRHHYEAEPPNLAARGPRPSSTASPMAGSGFASSRTTSSRCLLLVVSGSLIGDAAPTCAPTGDRQHCAIHGWSTPVQVGVGQST